MAKTKQTATNDNKKMTGKGTRGRSTKGSKDCKASNEAPLKKGEEEEIFNGIENDFENLGSQVESLRKEKNKVNTQIKSLTEGYKQVVGQVNDNGKSIDQLIGVINGIQGTVSYLAENAITKHDIDDSANTTNDQEDEDEEDEDDEDSKIEISKERRKVLMDLIASHDNITRMEESLAKLKEQIGKLEQDRKANAEYKHHQDGRGLWSSSVDLSNDGSMQLTLKS